MVVLPDVRPDATGRDHHDQQRHVAALEADAAALRAEVATLRTANQDLRAALERADARADRLIERIPLALTDQRAGRRRGWRWPWTR